MRSDSERDSDRGEGSGSAEAGRGPLDGFLVVDLTRILAGPYGTMLLAELGARVIKVERPGGGDEARALGPRSAGSDRSAYFHSVNRGKESIVLDLEAATDRRVFEALLERADVLAENFRPGVLEKLGYGWRELHARWPRLVLASTSGFGQTGPYRRRPAYDVVAQAMGGIMSLTGEPGRGPLRVGVSLGDLAAGVFTATGVLAALLDRERTGVGRQVDVALLDAQVSLVENAIARLVSTGSVPAAIGTRHPGVAPFQAFAAADGHLVVAAGNDELFDRLARVLEMPALARDDRFATNPARVSHVDELEALLAPRFVERSCAEWLALLEAAGVPASRVNDIADVIEDPQVRARNMIVVAEDDEAGAVPMAGNPIKLSGVDDPPRRRPAPRLDEHRRRLLAELGWGEEDGS